MPGITIDRFSNVIEEKDPTRDNIMQCKCGSNLFKEVKFCYPRKEQKGYLSVGLTHADNTPVMYLAECAACGHIEMPELDMSTSNKILMNAISEVEEMLKKSEK